MYVCACIHVHVALSIIVECGFVGLQSSKKRQKSDDEPKNSLKKAKMTIEDIDEDDDDDDSDADVCYLLTV